MAEQREYYYNTQLKNYLIQFMAIFAGMKVQVGKRDSHEPKFIKVPIVSASKDRVSAAIKGENTQNKPLRLPTMSAWLPAIDLAPEMRKGIPNNRRSVHMPSGGLFPDDITVVEQRMPVPYKGTFELSIWASNQDQHYQLLEQILMVFNPILQIQTSDEAFDWTKITQVELINIQPEENVPMDGDRRMIKTTLLFQVPMWISAPVEVHDRYVQDIFIRVGAISQGAESSEDIITDLDSQLIPYDQISSVDDIQI